MKRFSRAIWPGYLADLQRFHHCPRQGRGWKHAFTPGRNEQQRGNYEVAAEQRRGSQCQKQGRRYAFAPGRALGAAGDSRAALEHGAEVNVRDSGGFSPMHLAAIDGHQAIVELLWTTRRTSVPETMTAIRRYTWRRAESVPEVVKVLLARRGSGQCHQQER